MELTKQWMKENKACNESYEWMAKQKDINHKTIVNKLYNKKKYDWCLWTLYKTNLKTKFIIWLMMLLEYLLLGIGVYNIYLDNYLVALIIGAVVTVVGVGVTSVAVVVDAVVVDGIVVDTGLVVIGVTGGFAGAGLITGSVSAVAGVIGGFAGVGLVAVCSFLLPKPIIKLLCRITKGGDD